MRNRLLFNDRLIASIKPESKTRRFTDRKMPGLTLSVTAAGRKTWYFAYRFSGKMRWLKLGEYPEMPLADARRAALSARHAVKVEGKDPAAERRTEPPETPPQAPPDTPDEYLFRDFVKVFIAHQKTKILTWRDNENNIRRYLLPAWGHLPLRSITRRHIHEVLDRLVDLGMAAGVNRIHSLISRMFMVALDRGLVDAHPAMRMIKRVKETGRDRVLSDDELRALWEGLDRFPGAAADAMRLRILTGQRMERQITLMEWSELDFVRNIWTIPRTRMKAGKPHVVPLSPTVREILLRRRSEVPESERRVFPRLRLDGKEYRALNVLRQGYDWKDLRRTVTTRLAELRVPKEIRKAILSHARGDVEDRHYNRYLPIEDMRRALDAWDAELRAIVSGERSQKVLDFRR